MDTVLGLKIDPSQVTTAVKELDRLSAATLKAEAALAKMGKTSGSTDDAARDLALRFQAQGRAGQSADASYAKLGNRLQFIEKAQQKVGEAAEGSALASAALDKQTARVQLANADHPIAAQLPDLARRAALGTIDKLSAELSRYVEMARSARNLEIDTTTLQVFERQFEQMDLLPKDVQPALEAFRNAARERFESGSLRQQPSRLQQKLDDLFLDRPAISAEGRQDYIRATNNDERLRAVIRSIRELQQAGDTAAANDLADTAFDRSGRRVADAVRQNGFNIDQLAQAGLRNGTIIAPDVIGDAAAQKKRADEAREELTTAARLATNDAVRGTLEVTRPAVETAEKLAGWGSVLAQAYRYYIGSQLGSGAESRGQQQETPVSPERAASASIPALPSDGATTPTGELSVPTPRPPDAPRMPPNLRDAANRAGAAGNAAIARAGSTNGNPAANGGAEASQTPFQKASRTLAERSKALETEGQVVGLGTAEREAILEFEKALNALKLDRDKLSADELRRLREQATVVGEVAAQTERAKDAQAQKMELEGAGRDALKGILLAPTAKNPIDALVSSLDRFRQKLLDMAANELLDTLFGKKGKNAGLLGNGLLGSLGNLFGFGGAPGAPLDLGSFMITNAKGNVFAPGGLHAFALGGAFTNGIVHRPTLFPFANGIGLMGEAGPEAIMPLRRDSAGRLGVGAALAANSGGRPVQVTVNNNAGAMVTESHDGQGNVTFDIERLADQVDARSAARIASRNSPVGNAMAGTYGLQQKPVVG